MRRLLSRMNRSELEHVLRASSAITDENEFIVIGSQAILGKFPDAPRLLRQSIEVDLYPKKRPELAEVIDGSIGELSAFHHEFGYYAHGIGPETAILPQDWQIRLVPVQNANTRQAIGFCLHPLDLAYSKLAAGRTKDLEYLKRLFRYGYVKRTELKKLIAGTNDEKLKTLLETNYRALAGKRASVTDFEAMTKSRDSDVDPNP